MSYTTRQSVQVTPESFKNWQSTASPNQQVNSPESLREQLRLAREEQDAAWAKAKEENPELAAQVEAVMQSPPREEQSIVGMVSVPVATDFTESKQSLNELTTQRGDLATVPDIDLCGFMSNLPDSDFDLPEIPDIQADLERVYASIQGITLPAVTFISEGIDDIVGTIDTAIGDLGAAAQAAIPKLSCGKKPISVDVVGQIPALGSAFSLPSDIPESPEAVEQPSYGTQPIIVIDSPEVTVEALDDQIDLGEF